MKEREPWMVGEFATAAIGPRGDLLSCAVALMLLLSLGCGDESVVNTPSSSETSPGGMTGTSATSNATTASMSGSGSGGIGDPCVSDGGCRSGLVCELGACEPDGQQRLGEPCELTAACESGLYCSTDGICQAAGEGDLGALCVDSGDCLSGLVCSTSTWLGQCSPGGEGDVGESCEGVTDCLAGLFCSSGAEGQSCHIADALDLSEVFIQPPCAQDNGPDLPVRVYFEVPRADDVDEFYRLPFPNDIRRDGSKVEMSGHSSPGADPLGVDLFGNWLEALGTSGMGFGVNQGVRFRFSAPVDLGSLTARGDDSTVTLIDITPTSPEYNLRQALQWESSTGRNKYICQNWLHIRPAWGRPLAPNTTYAALITTGAKGVDGDTLGQDADFGLMISDARPGDETLGRAWDTYAPLRAWLQEQGKSTDSIAGAAVFTTGDPTALPKRLRSSVIGSGVPTAVDLTVCQDGITSPCDDGLVGDNHVRGCFEESDQFFEIHGRLSVPVFQSGDLPYLFGGGIAVDDGGEPILQRAEDACMAMTVPRATVMPAEGWPLVVFMHGLGESFRSHIEPLSGPLSTIQSEASGVNVATMSWDQALHGARRGDSGLRSEQLWLNYQNPEVVVGSRLQVAAELFAVMNWVRQWNLSAENSPTGDALMFDPEQVYVVGRDQGGEAMTIAAAIEPTLKGLIYGGTGGGLSHSLIGQSSPADLGGLFEDAIQEQSVGISHPTLAVMQSYYDQVDPAFFAELISARPLEGVSPKHVFFAMGIDDSWVAQNALETLASSLRVGMASPLIEPFQVGGVDELMLPIVGNVSYEGEPYTVAGRQFEPDGYDGHGVLYESSEARDSILKFVAEGVLNGIPALIEP